VRAVSWNVNHWQRREPDRWNIVLDGLRQMGAQVALLQEALPPVNGGRVAFQAIDPQNPRLRWGTAIVAVGEAVTLAPWSLVPLGRAEGPRDVEVSHPGTVVVADVLVDGAPVCTVVSLYGQQVRAGNGTKYASTVVHRQISDLVTLLDSSRNKGARVLVAGDLNVTTQWDTNRRDRQMDASVFARMEAHGFRELVREAVANGHQPDCFCPEAGVCRHVRTLRWRDMADSRPWQTDYAFASATLQATATVLDEELWWSLSDHAPVIIDVEPA
jgi:hypothetical protein